MADEWEAIDVDDDDKGGLKYPLLPPRRDDDDVGVEGVRSISLLMLSSLLVLLLLYRIPAEESDVG